MFDHLIDEVAGRFGLSGDKARQLLGMLTGLIFSQGSGFSGFIDKFRQQGLGDVAQSWVGTGPNQPISPAQVEGVLGQSAIGEMAGKLGVSGSTVSGALSGLLPGVVNGLTEGGQVPSGIPAGLSGMLGGLGDLGKAGLGAGAAAMGAGAAAVGAGATALGSGARAVGDGASRAADATGDAVRAAGGGLGKLLPWLLIGAVVIAGLFLFRSCQHREAMPATDAASATADTSAAGDGMATEPAVPADAMSAASSAASEPISGEADAAAPADAGVATAPEPTPGEADMAPADANTALDQLSGKAFNAGDLVKALNLMIIHFDTGSAKISADSLDVLDKAAAAIKAAPTGTRIEVGGHTDNTGNAAANQRLSQARAEAVSTQLASDGVDAALLSSKGYGQDQPVADNATADGRAKNRRIEFAVQP